MTWVFALSSDQPLARKPSSACGLTISIFFSFTASTPDRRCAGDLECPRRSRSRRQIRYVGCSNFSAGI